MWKFSLRTHRRTVSDVHDYMRLICFYMFGVTADAS